MHPKLDPRGRVLCSRPLGAGFGCILNRIPFKNHPKTGPGNHIYRNRPAKVYRLSRSIFYSGYRYRLPTLPVLGLIGNGDDGCGTSAGCLAVAEICRGRWHRDCLVAQLVSVHWTEEAYDVR